MPISPLEGNCCGKQDKIRGRSEHSDEVGSVFRLQVLCDLKGYRQVVALGEMLFLLEVGSPETGFRNHQKGFFNPRAIHTLDGPRSSLGKH